MSTTRRAVPGQLDGRLDRAVGVAAGGQEHVVRAAAAGDLGQLGERRVSRSSRRPDSSGARPSPRGGSGPGTGSMPIACTPAATSSRTTSWPISPRPMTHGRVAELDLGPAHAVHGDGRHGGERGVLRQHAVRGPPRRG